MAEWFTETPTLEALTKLINLYFYFKVGYDNGMANDLAQYILTNDELAGLQDLLNTERLRLEASK